MRYAECKTASRIFKALGSESGVRIFDLLRRTKELCVSDIAEEVGLSMSATSHQLQKMEALELVESVREGRTICYMLKDNSLNQDIAQCLQTFRAKGRERLKVGGAKTSNV